ncbi:conserved hypothetical protein [Desulforapulum autotrophicum HRM2]|uniref:Uncharacterized protein n=1 Tax=Desulforapulum autotrophicum (strain ATCC 43914 / DSM 3382 / VKM B-1955 / HRM2) TaxID=177437 RepID=C0QC55_DESAH|nr:hypothetical protein [Desulforapulum autotrophicum]ACN17072.1 conserved hypothetical protein [Desulforapulum autotrophicum HRM2]
MQPRGYLTFVSRQWNLITALFELNKEGPIDQYSLLQAIRRHDPETDAFSFIETLVSYTVLSQIFTSQTLYTLGDLTEQIVEDLLSEQQLGLSESIRVHMSQFDMLSIRLTKAVEARDADALSRVIKKINKQTQTIKRQTRHDYKAIENLVAESKKKDTAIPLKQRYADILDAWDQYIAPMGEMIDPWSAFDQNTDKVINRLEKAVETLERGGSLTGERDKIHIAKQMLIDMRMTVLGRFKLSRELLQPLYEVARLNSRVTRGTSIVLDYLRKNKFQKIESMATLNWFSRERSPLISHDLVLLKYYAGYKNIKENPAPPISMLSEQDKAERFSRISVPLDRHSIIQEIRSALPIKDGMQWAIQRYPEFSTGKILDIVLLMMTEKTFRVKKSRTKTYQTPTHGIHGFSIKVENA